MPSPDAPARVPDAMQRPPSARGKHDTRTIEYSPERLADMRRRYQGTAESCDDIARGGGISRPTLRKLALRDGWVRFRRPPLDLSDAVKLDARLAETERALAAGAERTHAPGASSFFLPPRSDAPSSTLPPRSGGEGRIAIAASDCDPGWGAACEIANPTELAEPPLPPTPDPSPPLASLAGGGEEPAAPPASNAARPAPSNTPPPDMADPVSPAIANLPDTPAQPAIANQAAPASTPAGFHAVFRRSAEAALIEAQAQIEAVTTARLQMQETGRFAQAAALGRDLAAITNTLHRIKRIHGGATDEPLAHDDLSDLDQRRDALARRIDAVLAQWMDAESPGPAG